jgi:hypothetical protein
MGLAHIATTDDADANLSAILHGGALPEIVVSDAYSSVGYENILQPVAKAVSFTSRFGQWASFVQPDRANPDNMPITGDGLYVPRFQRG